MNIDDIAADTLLPSQWAAMYQSVERTGEQRLVVALVEEALDCYCGSTSADVYWTDDRPSSTPAARRERLHREAAAWIFDTDYRGAYGFTWACEVLGLNADLLRTKLHNGEVSQFKRAHRTGRGALRTRCTDSNQRRARAARERRRKAKWVNGDGSSKALGVTNDSDEN